MTIPIHDEIAVCPACSRHLPYDALCECDEPDIGPLCARCCERYHRAWVA